MFFGIYCTYWGLEGNDTRSDKERKGGENDDISIGGALIPKNYWKADVSTVSALRERIYLVEEN